MPYFYLKYLISVPQLECQSPWHEDREAFCVLYHWPLPSLNLKPHLLAPLMCIPTWCSTALSLLQSFTSPCLWHAVPPPLPPAAASPPSFPPPLLFLLLLCPFFLLMPLLTLSTSEIPVHHSVSFSLLFPCPKRVVISCVLIAFQVLVTLKSHVTYFLDSSTCLDLLTIGTSLIYLLCTWCSRSIWNRVDNW